MSTKPPEKDDVFITVDSDGDITEKKILEVKGFDSKQRPLIVDEDGSERSLHWSDSEGHWVDADRLLEVEEDYEEDDEDDEYNYDEDDD